MTETKETIVDGAVHQRGHHLWGETVYPFYSQGGKRKENVRCFPSHNFTGLVDVRGKDVRGILAVHDDERGLFTTFTAQELREGSEMLAAMADHVEDLERKRGNRS